MHLLDKVVQHPFRDIKVADDTVAQRADSDNVCRSAPHHFLGVQANGQNLLGFLFDGYNRGLVDDDALAPNIDQRIGCAQVDTDVLRKHAQDEINRTKHVLPSFSAS